MADILVGSPKLRNHKYPIDGRGLFIFVANHEFQYHSCFKRNIAVRNCMKKRCIETLDNMKKALNVSEPNHIILERPNLYREDCSRKPSLRYSDDPFPTLIQEVADKVKDEKPSFLVFVLVSAGEKFAKILLAGDERGCVDCPDDNHKFAGRCQQRRLSDLVKAIQEASCEIGSLFSGIPKIFLVQTFSGVKRSELQGKYRVPERKKIKADDYIPRGSDVFVFYAHTEEENEWMVENGFYLIDKFCETVQRTKGENVVLKEFICSQEANECSELDIKSECVTDSWFDNICTTTAASISQFLQDKKHPVHFNVHMSSTLRYRLSMKDILGKSESL